ncbi:CHAT domain-containing protein [Sedimentitalea sp.]|uniref:CHAT domain-containing protein n=1 Tax=Sedimentitalea sp. TaxID=2048915 RepID=UPI0032996BC9
MRSAEGGAIRGEALNITQLLVRRDDNGRVKGIRIGAGAAEFDLDLDAADQLPSVISDALERDLNAPYLRSARYKRAVDGIARRGLTQGTLLNRMCEDSLALSRACALNLFGDAALFDYLWEAVLSDERGLPVAIEKPVVRVVSGSRPYPARLHKDGVRVVAISARVNWSTDIPPRQVTGPLRQVQSDTAVLRIGVIAPAYPNEIEASILPVPGLEDPRAGGPVLHIDAHGILLSYVQLMSRYEEIRAPFVQQSWGLKVEPYSGVKSFALINGLSAAGDLIELPVSGEELGGLCRQAGVPLVILNACQAASELAEGGLAADLVKFGVPDVIAFRHMVTADSAATFVSEVYSALAQGASAAQACCLARAALYERGVAALPEGAHPFPDWISLVHYSANPSKDILQPISLARPDWCASSASLPIPLEWALLKTQEVIYQMRLSRHAPEFAGLPSPRPIVLFGPIGAGAEALLMDTTAWLANTDLQVSGATVFDVGEGLERAVRLYLPEADESWSDDQIADSIVERWGPMQAVGFLNLELALDSGKIDRSEYGRIMRLAAILSSRVGPCLVHSSRDLFAKPFSDALGVSVPMMTCWPTKNNAIVEWLSADRSEDDDREDVAVTILLAWISAGFVDVAAIAKGCSGPEQRKVLLDHMVFGTRLSHPSQELWILHTQILARWKVVSREANTDLLLPLVAGVASGISVGELAQVGRSIGGERFPLIPRVSFKEISPIQAELLRHGLISECTADISQCRDEESRFRALRLNPFLRPLALAGLSEELRDELSRWTVSWAIDKIHYFSNDWLKPEKRPSVEIYIEHAWPLFAVAIWSARLNSVQSTNLRAAIDRAWAIGWWPRDVDLRMLLQPDDDANAQDEQSEFYRLWQRATNLQMQGDFEEARNLLFLAIESIGGEAGGHQYYAAQYRLGTLSLDLNDLSLASEHLRIAAEGAAYEFVAPDTLAHIVYEQGILARKRGREESALERFKSSINLAHKLGLQHLLLLNFQELTDIELAKIPIVMSDCSNSELESDWRNHIAQAEAYLRSAHDAKKRLNEPSPEEGTMLLLEARILAARSDFSEARKKALRALEAYHSWDDHRTKAVTNFLALLDVMGLGANDRADDDVKGD